MSYILSPLLSYVLLYKYAAIFAVIYAAAVILPLPTNAMLLAVGAFSSQGYFSFWVSLAIATAGNTLGDLTDFWIARTFGERAIRWFRLDRFRFFTNLKEELRTDAIVTVFTTRFAGSLSPITNFLAGIVGMPLNTFFWPDLLGNAIEPFGALFLGYLAGDYWSDFSGILGIVAGIVAVSVLIFVLLRMYRRIMKKYS